jgi:hypothetical protein
MSLSAVAMRRSRRSGSVPRRKASFALITYVEWVVSAQFARGEAQATAFKRAVR